MNPELTYTLPEYQTCSGAADMMFHTMERYMTLAKNVDLIDRVSEGILVSVKEAALTVKNNPYDYDGRATLMWAGSLSHNGLTGTGRINDFPVHKLGHELSAMFDATHGASITAVWSSWAKYVYKSIPNKFARFAVKVMGVEENFDDINDTCIRGIEAFDDWCHKIGMPTTITELLGFTPNEKQIEEMANKAADTGGGKICLIHPLYPEDIIQIYKHAL